MQFFKKTMDAAKNYEFFKGSNIFDKMNNSTFGVFHNNIKKMDIPMDDFRLPIITIIGNESSGKSSLISNILKCDIFPINKKRCTKCPIKIQLVNSQTEKYQITFKGSIITITNKEDILDNVIKIMTNIDDIIEDELHILFSNSNVITSTYYDLPGIIEYPDELRQKSKAIVNKYIIQANTLIICVIPASTPRLTSNQALGLIIDAKKTKDCIIALSMVDLLHDDDMETFINRIIMKSDEINNLNIHNIIGLSNNKKIDENKWFADNILKYINDKTIEDEIISKITIDNLLKSVDVMYDTFIKLNWKGKAITTADNKILKLEKEYEELGREDLEITDVYNHIKSIGNFGRIVGHISPHLFFNNEKDKYGYNYNNYSKYNDDMEHITDIYENIKNDILERANSYINDAFKINNPYKLVRFEKLRQYIIKEYTIIIKNHYNHIDIWFKSYLDNFKYVYNNKKLFKFQEYIRDNLNRYIYDDLWNNNNLIDLNNNDLLTENYEWKIKRDLINKSIKNYKKLKIFFENL